MIRRRLSPAFARKSTCVALTSALLLAACGSPAPRATTPVQGGVPVDPAALYCQGTGGTVIPRTSQGRRADLCRMRDGRVVSAGALLNSHNDL